MDTFCVLETILGFLLKSFWLFGCQLGLFEIHFGFWIIFCILENIKTLLFTVCLSYHKTAFEAQDHVQRNHHIDVDLGGVTIHIYIYIYLNIDIMYVWHTFLPSTLRPPIWQRQCIFKGPSIHCTLVLRWYVASFLLTLICASETLVWQRFS